MVVFNEVWSGACSLSVTQTEKWPPSIALMRVVSFVCLTHSSFLIIELDSLVLFFSGFLVTPVRFRISSV